MSGNISFKNDYAVSEVVGSILLVLMAVCAFVAIYLYMTPSGPDYDASVKIEGMICEDGNIMLQHVSGDELEEYRILVSDSNGETLGYKTGYNWGFSEYVYPLNDITDIRLVDDSVSLGISVYSINEDRSQQEVFNWKAIGSYGSLRTDCPILISSLRTNVVDEDLICYSYPVIPEINATNYIYNWKVNGLSLTHLNMPFNTENNVTAKDYSGYGIDGTMVGAAWSSEGIIGGSCYFDGSSEYVTMDLPYVFYDIENNDFTVSLWIKSDDITADNAVVLMASYNNDNFFKIFLQGMQVHVGLCVNGIKDAVRTDNLSSSEWYHIVGVWDASEELLLIYWNGEGGLDRLLPGYRNFAMGSGTELLEMGHGTASSKFWDGNMDELEIYNKALSEEQIYQIYFTTKDGDYSRRVAVSEETSIGEYWQCVVTPNDGTQDDEEVASNILQIVGYSGGD